MSVSCAQARFHEWDGLVYHSSATMQCSNCWFNLGDRAFLCNPDPPGTCCLTRLTLPLKAFDSMLGSALTSYISSTVLKLLDDGMVVHVCNLSIIIEVLGWVGL